MKHIIQVGLLLAAMAALSACGQKGPLQLPTETAETDQSEQAKAKAN
ncbi:MAG: lipoprotein [Cellvibrionaceae bacterium]|nr:lipoprotein [Cellvibrionaceae bacterium]